MADGKKQEAAQAAFVPAALGIRGRKCQGRPSLRFITVARGIRGLTLHKEIAEEAFSLSPGFSGLKKEVDSHQTGFLFRPL